MKNFRILFLAIFFAAMVAGNLHAVDIETSGSASVDIMSNYVWRGQKLSNSVVIQPSVGITYGSFDANIWANYDSDRSESDDTKSGHGEFTETDVTLSYSLSLDKLNFTAGYIYYALEGANDTQELFLSTDYDTLLSPALTVYYDYDEGQGAFIIASVGHSFDVAKKLSLAVGATASYNINNKIMGFDEDGEDFSNFYTAELSSSLSIPISNAMTLAPKAAYSFPLSNDAEEALEGISDDGDEDVFYGGINLTISF